MLIRRHFIAALLIHLFASYVPAAPNPGATQPFSSQSKTLDPNATAKLDRAINLAVASGKCPGAVLLIGRGDTVLYEKAYGNRTLAPTPQPMTIDTVFDMASLTKPIATATSILILSQRSQISLSDPVAKYLPDFAANGKERITIADLLLHVGGLPPDNEMSDFNDGPAAAWKPILGTKPIRRRGEQFIYSDVGFMVLGRIVETVSKRPLNAFASDEIFKPLKMSSTFFEPDRITMSRFDIAQTADGHKEGAGPVNDPRARALGGVAGHAGLFCTAADLSRFCRMLIHRGSLDGAKILDPETVADMIRPRPVPLTRSPSDSAHHARSASPATSPSKTAVVEMGLRGYGLDIDTPYSGPRGERFPRGVSFGHTGFTGTSFWIDPQSGCYVILLTNSVYAGGHGDVRALRKEVGTLAAEACLGPAATQR